MLLRSAITKILNLLYRKTEGNKFLSLSYSFFLTINYKSFSFTVKKTLIYVFYQEVLGFKIIYQVKQASFEMKRSLLEVFISSKKFLQLAEQFKYLVNTITPPFCCNLIQVTWRGGKSKRIESHKVSPNCIHNRNFLVRQNMRLSAKFQLKQIMILGI